MSTNGRILQTRLFAIILVLGCGLTGRAYEFPDGTGEPNDPYQIATVDDLLAVGSSKDLLTKHYVLVNDLDLDPNLPGGRVFEDALIAASVYVAEEPLAPFSGVLDGAGHTIRNLCVSCEQGSGVGLIGNLSGQVRDLHVQGARISGWRAVGAIAGFVFDGSILHCSAAGEISGTTGAGGMVGHLSEGILVDCRAEAQVRGVQLVGGLFGSTTGGTVNRCEARGQVDGEQFVGGLGGHLMNCFIIENRATGVVAGADDVGGLLGYVWRSVVLGCGAVCDVVAQETAGGLIGIALVQNGPIMDCYAQGSVTGSLTGGLVGSISSTRVLNCYAACEMIPMASGDGTTAVMGGLFGESQYLAATQVTGCFWDAELSGASVGAGSGPASCGTGLTTEQMQQKTTFEQAGWNLNSTWVIAEGEYPVLQWESAVDATQE